MLDANFSRTKLMERSSAERFAGARFSFCARLLMTFAVALAAFCAFAASASAQNSEYYLDENGTPAFSSPAPTEYGYVEQANGHVHIEIPLGNTIPQRGGQKTQFSIAYDSNIWSPGSIWGMSAQWLPSGSGSAYPIAGGWKLLGVPGMSPSEVIINGSTCIATSVMGTDSTSHWFPTCTTASYATDSSGYYYFYPINFGGESGPVVYGPDGSVPYTPAWGWGSIPPAISEDANGNDMESCGIPPLQNYPYDNVGICDPAGRTMLEQYNNGVTNGTTQYFYKVPNSQGTLSNYQVNVATISVKSNFGQSGITECSENCTVEVVSSIVLPDGNSYSFKYDCDDTISGQSAVCGSPSGQSAYYGELTQMTAPQGGTINYAWQVFSDSYKNAGVWLETRAAGGGTWTYTPQVISNCGATQVGCQQSLTVLTPSGRSTTTTTTLDNGAWPTKVQDQLTTSTTTWDFSHSCVISSCIGHSYITKQAETQTITGAGGVQLTKQTTYTYDTQSGITYDGLITAVKEWEYQPDSNPSFPSTPDRATYTTWYSPASSPVGTYGATNVHKPASVTVCNNSGSDSACPGGGSRVSQTITTYDGVAPTAKTGIVNHDDYNYPATLTVRGLPTSVQQWVSGSTYLTSTYSYDSTG